MSRKTKLSRPVRPRRDSPLPRFHVGDTPRVERPLLLICSACGASARYHVGTVTIDPFILRSSDHDAMKEAVGFTGYFRCRKCDAGGPWELPFETMAYVAAMVVADRSGIEEVPLILGRTVTFDQRAIRYATDGEAHLKELIDKEPERAFLRVRLGNLYSHAGLHELAETSYERAIELDPKDIEAHGMLAELLIDADRSLDAVPHLHAVINHARDARQVNKELRRNLVREAIESLLTAHAESNGQIEFLPDLNPDEMVKRETDEPVVIELREFDLSSEKGMDDLCDVFVEPLGQRGRGLFRRRRKRVPDASADWPATPIQRAAAPIGRNEPCPCGSGHKHKKCCGRR